jgi:hypothetical protein
MLESEGIVEAGSESVVAQVVKLLLSPEQFAH